MLQPIRDFSFHCCQAHHRKPQKRSILFRKAYTIFHAQAFEQGRTLKAADTKPAMTEMDDLVTTMRQQAKTYVNATCVFTALESEWVEIVTKHNKLIEEKRPGFVYGAVRKDRFDELFKYLSKDWERDCKCEHLNQDSDLDTY